MSEGNSDSTQQTEPYRSNFGKMFNDNEEGINNYITQMINQDLDSLYPETIINKNLINTQPQFNQLNIPVNPNGSITLRLFPQNPPITSEININPIYSSEINSNRDIPILKANKNNYKLKGDFNQESWKKFYPITDPFFNYNDGDNLQMTKITTRNEENPNMIDDYEGQVNERGERHGFGKLTSGNKTKIGHWDRGQFTGWGREINNNGEIYEGKFINGNLFGKGIYSNGKEIYFGEFRNKKMIGFGEIFTEDYHYIGQIWNKIPNGKGEINIYNEGTYEGNFQNGEIDGFGVFKWNNGNYYVGEMKKGKMHGYGKLVHSNGKVENGYFSDDNFVKAIKEN